MKVCRTVEELRVIRWADPSQQWGLVPTMGYLHEAHLSLVQRARAENDCVAVSIYVNPTQFSPNEDLEAYPRDVERDLELLRRQNVDLVFIPADAEIYPPGFQTMVIVSDVTQVLEGAARPTHFQGVTTVVAKLFNIVQPQRAYFGQKDAQQSVVVRRMVTDLNFNVDIVVCPTVREEDGLAMSSRNVRLSPEQRRAAPVLFQALSGAKAALEAGERQGDRLRQLLSAAIRAEPLARLDYASVADPQTLEELDTVEDGALLLMAVFFGDVRLIDNMLVDILVEPSAGASSTGEDLHSI